jgi:hypothetical protein
VIIDWNKSTFIDPYGRTAKIAHATTRWADRYGTQAQTTLAACSASPTTASQATSSWNRAAAPDQLHRPILPEDASAPQFNDAVFGMDLVFLVEDQPRTYSFRFKVASILPR